MRHLFADTFYWVALFSPRDRWHEQALAISRTLGEDHLWTTDEVLTEFLAICSAAGPRLRQRAVNLVRRMLTDPGITVLPQTHASFLGGLTLYEQRPDKHYSLSWNSVAESWTGIGVVAGLLTGVGMIEWPYLKMA